jgi:thermitase
MKFWQPVAFTIACALMISAGHAEQTIIIKPAVSSDDRLSPELSLVLEMKGEFLGLTKDNRTAIKLDDSQLPRAMAAGGPAKIAKAGDYQSRSLLIRYAKGAQVAKTTLAAAGLMPDGGSDEGSFLVGRPEGGVTAEQLGALLNDKAVTHIEPDFILSLPPNETGAEVVSAEVATLQTPNDTLFPLLWGMKNIHAPKGWDSITDAPEIIVAVIDSGVDYNHKDLAGNMWKSSAGNVGRDFFEDDDDPMDENSHGTHCAGTIAGVGNNGLGVAGVAWQTKIMALRFLGPNGSGSTSDAIACIDWAVDQGAHILSNSWGGGGFSQNLKDAIDRAESQGVLFIAAAGNSGTNNDVAPHFPSNYDNLNIISVAAIDDADSAASFSCFGQQTVDIGAPGVDITSSIPDHKYASFNGTSMATPHVAGAAVLTWAKTFTTPLQDVTQMQTVRDLILKNARQVNALSDSWGHSAPAFIKGGVLDIAFLDGTGPTPPPTPTPSPACCPVIAAAQFNFGEVTTEGQQTIIDVKLKLSAASDVHISANTSVQTAQPGPFSIGFSDQAADHMWVPSLRWVQPGTDDEWVNCGSTVHVKLPAGTHLLRWNIWADDDTEVKFDSGSMLIQAYPHVMSSTIAAVEGATFGRPKVTTDTHGNAGITKPLNARRGGHSR